MNGRFEAEFKTPWALMKASEEGIRKIFFPVGRVRKF